MPVGVVGSTVRVGTASVAFAVLVPSVAVGAAVVVAPLDPAATASIVAVFGLAALVQQRGALWHFSPVLLVVASYVGIAFFGLVFWNDVAQETGVSLPLQLTNPQIQGSFTIFVGAACAALAGALVTGLAAPPLRGVRVAVVATDTGKSDWTKRWAVLFVVASLALPFVAYGPALIYRTTYLPGEPGDLLGIAARTLVIPGAVVLGWFTQRAGPRLSRVFAYMGLLLCGAITLSLATRALALLPLAAVLGRLASRRASRHARLLLPLAAVASIALLQLPLALRDGTEHGIVPYLERLFSGSVVLPGLEASISNVAYSFGLAGVVAFQRSQLELTGLLTSIDPRPGNLTDWYDLAPILRLDLYTPYSAVGELANLGWQVLLLFYFLVGCFLAYLDRRIHFLFQRDQSVLALVLVALAAFFVVESLQYNLRSSVRVLYYMFAADAFLRVSSWVPAWRARRLAT